jgi:hypothetical protein
MLVRFIEENDKLLAVIDPFAIPASQFNDYTGNVIAEAIKERSRRGLSTGVLIEDEQGNAVSSALSSQGSRGSSGLI